MPSTLPEPAESFKVWILRPVAQAVEAGEVPAGLLTDLQADIEAAKEILQNEGHAAAIRQIADLAGVDRPKASEVLAIMEAQFTTTWGLVLRRIVEAWREGERKVWVLTEHMLHRLTANP